MTTLAEEGARSRGISALVEQSRELRVPWIPTTVIVVLVILAVYSRRCLLHMIPRVGVLD